MDQKYLMDHLEAQPWEADEKNTMDTIAPLTNKGLHQSEKSSSITYNPPPGTMNYGGEE